jgi:deazaflavin-dependent oxidoreductase (nitroreductase family)
MARNPDKVWIEMGKRKLKVEPESLKGDERAEAWRRIVSLAPGYAAYQEKTDRQIPVVRLRPTG